MYEYEVIFPEGSMVRRRFDAVVKGIDDPFPGSSGSMNFETAITALTNGKPDPFAKVVGSKGMRKAKSSEYPLIPAVARCFQQLFKILEGGD